MATLTVTLFIAVFAVIYVQMVQGHDPALSNNTTTTSSAASSSSTDSASSTSSDDSSSSQSSSPAPVQSSQS